MVCHTGEFRGESERHYGLVFETKKLVAAAGACPLRDRFIAVRIRPPVIRAAFHEALRGSEHATLDGNAQAL